MSDEADERLIRGPKGDRGEQGARGVPGMTRGARRGFVYLSILMLLLAGLNLLWTSRQVDALNAKTSALCRFDSDLGGAPITVNPKTGKAALLSVAIVSDARVAWHQTGCTGPLPPPDPSFRQWAAYYHLPVG